MAKMLLAQLPSELLEPILELAGDDSRRASRCACRALRSASLALTSRLTCTVGDAADLAALVALSAELLQVKSVTIRPTAELVDAVLRTLPGLRVGSCATVVLPENADGESALRAMLEAPPDRRPVLLGARLGDDKHGQMRELLLAAAPHLDDVRLTMRRYDMELIRAMLPLTSYLDMDVWDAPPPEWADLRPTRPTWFCSSRMSEGRFKTAVQPFGEVLESVTLDASVISASLLQQVFDRRLRTVKLCDNAGLGTLRWAFNTLEVLLPKELHLCGGWREWNGCRLAKKIETLTFCYGMMRIDGDALRALDYTLKIPGMLHIWAEGCVRDDQRLASFFDIVQGSKRTISFSSSWEMPLTRAVLAAKGLLGSTEGIVRCF